MSGNEPLSETQANGAAMPEALAAAATNFGTALHAAWPSAAAERTVMEAYAGYTSVLQQALQAPEVAQRAADRHSAYTQSVREAFADDASRQRVLDAFQQYVEDLKRAWPGVDPAGLTPERLAAFAESAAWVAGVAAAVGRAR